MGADSTQPSKTKIRVNEYKKLEIVPRLIISVLEARKILGRDSRKLHDEQVEKLVIDLDEVAKIHLGVHPEISNLSSTTRGGKGYSN